MRSSRIVTSGDVELSYVFVQIHCLRGIGADSEGLYVSKYDDFLMSAYFSTYESEVGAMRAADADVHKV